MKKFLFVLIFLLMSVYVNAQVSGNSRARPVSADPASCAGGQLIYRTDTGAIKYCNLGSWSTLGSGGGSVSGTTNTIPVFTSSTAIGDSKLTTATSGVLLNYTQSSLSLGATTELLGITGTISNSNGFLIRGLNLTITKTAGAQQITGGLYSVTNNSTTNVTTTGFSTNAANTGAGATSTASSPTAGVAAMTASATVNTSASANVVVGVDTNSGATGGGTINTKLSLFRGRYTNSASTVADVRGLDLSGWTHVSTPTTTVSYGIFIDPTIDVGATRWAFYSTSTSPSLFSGKVNFTPTATTAGLNVGALAGDPSAPVNGDVWYDSTANELTARINGANVALGSGGGGGANTALSNLASVAINTTLVSDTDNTDDLGSSSVGWKDIYFAGNIKSGSNILMSYSSGIVLGNGGQNNDLRYTSTSIGNALSIQASTAKTVIGVNTGVGAGNAQLHIKSTSASLAGFQVDSAASPTANLLSATINGTGAFSINKFGQIVSNEITTDPTTAELGDMSQVGIYMKNNKLVIAYNNAGTITYLTIPLDGSTTTWTQSTTAP